MLMFPFLFWSNYVSSAVLCLYTKHVQTNSTQDSRVQCMCINLQAVVNMEIKQNIFRHANRQAKDSRDKEMHMYKRFSYCEVSLVVHLSISTRSIDRVSRKILIFYSFMADIPLCYYYLIKRYVLFSRITTVKYEILILSFWLPVSVFFTKPSSGQSYHREVKSV
jgi:hypothetical protein